MHYDRPLQGHEVADVGQPQGHAGPHQEQLVTSPQQPKVGVARGKVAPWPLTWSQVWSAVRSMSAPVLGM